MYTAAAQALDDFFIGNIDVDDVVDANAFVFQGFSLWDGTREAVEQAAIGAIRLRQALFDRSVQ